MEPNGWIDTIEFTQDGSAWVSGSTTGYRSVGGEGKEFTLPSDYRFVGLYDVATEVDGTVWPGTERGALRYDGLER